MSLALETINLTKNYGNKFKALDGLYMKVPKGSMYGFLGANGAGKTTTFGVIGGFINPDEGSFKFNGRLSVLPQDARFYAGRKLVKQLEYFSLLSGTDPQKARDDALNALDSVGLKDKADTTPSKISHGMFKRLGIAQALLGDPDILLLDEPIAGLDPTTAYKTREVIKKIAKDKTVIISSHNLSEISEMCDYVGIIDKGKMKYEGSVAAITQKTASIRFEVSKPVDKSIEKLFKDTPIKDVLSAKDNTFTVNYDSEYTQEAINRIVIEKLFKNGYGIREINPGKSLEEGFLDIVREG